MIQSFDVLIFQHYLELMISYDNKISNDIQAKDKLEYDLACTIREHVCRDKDAG